MAVTDLDGEIRTTGGIEIREIGEIEIKGSGTIGEVLIFPRNQISNTPMHPQAMSQLGLKWKNCWQNY